MSDLPWIEHDGYLCPVHRDSYVVVAGDSPPVSRVTAAGRVQWGCVTRYYKCLKDGTPIISVPGQEQGRKHDTGKPRYDLMPVHAEAEMVDVLTFGADKYGDENWRNVKKERYIAAAGRHRAAYRMGQTHDPETGKHHLAHAMCCDAFVIELDLKESEK